MRPRLCFSRRAALAVAALAALAKPADAKKVKQRPPLAFAPPSCAPS
jgi:hypothetical protein